MSEPHRPRLWMDITTSLRNRGSHATGTLRVERKLSEGLSKTFGPRLSYCQFDPVRGEFSPAQMPPPPEAGAARPSRGPGARDHRSASLGKRLDLGRIAFGMTKKLKEGKWCSLGEK